MIPKPKSKTVESLLDKMEKDISKRAFQLADKNFQALYSAYVRLMAAVRNQNDALIGYAEADDDGPELAPICRAAIDAISRTEALLRGESK